MPSYSVNMAEEGRCKKEAICTRPSVWVNALLISPWTATALHSAVPKAVQGWWYSLSYLPSPVYIHTWKKYLPNPLVYLYKRFPFHLHIWSEIITIFPDLADYAQTQSNIWELSQATHRLEQHSSNQYILLTFQVRTEEAHKLLSLVSINIIWKKGDSLYSIFRYSVPIKASIF